VSWEGRRAGGGSTPSRATGRVWWRTIAGWMHRAGGPPPAGRLDAHAIPSSGGVLDDVYERRRELHAGLAQFDFDEKA
jgi:hypothetical protein